MIYLDNAATTWPKPETVYQAVDHCLREVGGNPGRGSHTLARQGTALLCQAREALAGLFNINNPANIAFTYNATDAINTALSGLLQPGDHVVTTTLEHNAVARPLRFLEKNGVKLTIIGCDHTGLLNWKEMKDAVKPGIKAVVLSHASNVTGSVVPLAEIGQLAHRAGALLVVDAAQTAGVEEINVKEQQIDVLAFSGHKGLLGPQGTGGIYVRTGLVINPLRRGGTGSKSESDMQPNFMPDCLESGTPNTPGIAGLLAGVLYIRNIGQETIRQYEAALTKQLLDGLQRIPGLQVHGPQTRQPQTAVVSVSIKGADSGMIAFQLDAEYGIACRGGLHCAPWAHRALGTINTGTVRLSPGYFNTAADIDTAVEALAAIVKKERKR
jgi:cysteine desulfurase family protein